MHYFTVWFSIATFRIGRSSKIFDYLYSRRSNTKKRFLLNFPSISNPNSINTFAANRMNVELLNGHVEDVYPPSTYADVIPNTNSSQSSNIRRIQHVDLFNTDMQLFTDYVENIIKSDSSHQGYIHSCLHSIYNKNLLFFNITGNYRYCPKKKDHHQRNSVAIIINTRTHTYSIRCKDEQCDNTILIWRKM